MKGEQLPNFVAFLSSPQDQWTPKDGDECSTSDPTSRRRLNPNFVDWLLWVPGWTDCAPLATASWLCRLRQRLSDLCGE
jgi:hypothetical protein